MNASNIEATVRSLADKEAIRELAHRYAHAAWTKDVAAQVSLFSEDGEMHVGNVGGNVVLRGKTALLRGFEKMIAQREAYGPFPLVHSHIIELQGDTAVGTCYIDVRFGAEGKNVTSTGYYHDEYVRVDGEWKIRSRTLQMAFSQTDQR